MIFPFLSLIFCDYTGLGYIFKGLFQERYMIQIYYGSYARIITSCVYAIHVFIPMHFRLGTILQILLFSGIYINVKLLSCGLQCFRVPLGQTNLWCFSDGFFGLCLDRALCIFELEQSIQNVSRYKIFCLLCMEHSNLNLQIQVFLLSPGAFSFIMSLIISPVLNFLDSGAFDSHIRPQFYKLVFHICYVFIFFLI